MQVEMGFLVPLAGAAVLFVACALMSVAALATKDRNVSNEIFVGTLSFFVGGAIGAVLIATPIVVVGVMPLSKLLGIQTESVLMPINASLYAASFVICGVVCWKGMVKDMRAGRSRRRTQEAEAPSKKD